MKNKFYENFIKFIKKFYKKYSYNYKLIDMGVEFFYI